MKLDILAFGAHPDDIELSCSGWLLAEKANGKKTGVIDLTKGELSTRGTVDTRQSETDAASALLGLDVRENLAMPDGFFTISEENTRSVIQCIRTYKPEIVLCNAPHDRHPDHGRAATLVTEACFLSGLSKISTSLSGNNQEAWRPKYVFNYIQDRFIDPDFLVDISAVFEKKMEAIRAYKTQFYHTSMEGPETYISSPAFLEQLVARHAVLGKRIGVSYAEGYISSKKIGIRNMDALILTST
ncbi:MAG: bacillithiol biosynthesis deacetylase BshB1 [Ferruginibacter sp.]